VVTASDCLPLAPRWGAVEWNGAVRRMEETPLVLLRLLVQKTTTSECACPFLGHHFLTVAWAAGYGLLLGLLLECETESRMDPVQGNTAGIA
jgi:hypothetical protein